MRHLESGGDSFHDFPKMLFAQPKMISFSLLSRGPSHLPFTVMTRGVVLAAQAFSRH